MSLDALPDFWRDPLAPSPNGVPRTPYAAPYRTPEGIGAPRAYAEYGWMMLGLGIVVGGMIVALTAASWLDAPR